MGSRTQMRIYTRKKESYTEYERPNPTDSTPWMFFREVEWESHNDLDYLLEKPGANYLATVLPFQPSFYLRARKRPYSALLSQPTITPLEDINVGVDFVFILEGDWVFQLHKVLKQTIEERQQKGYEDEEDIWLLEKFEQHYDLMYYLQKELNHEFVIEYWFE